MLFTSLPIFWPEGPLRDVISGDTEVHWARAALEKDFDLVPVDTLTLLDPPGLLLMAQPRALTGEENVALDDWVRGGGRALVILDPMLDVHSVYGLGDRRRPEAMAMLSPILRRWGLELVYDETQPRGERIVAWGNRGIPVEEAGRFVLTGNGHASRCELVSGGLLASCRIGEGKALLVADATFLAGHGEADGGHADRTGARLLPGLIEALRAPAKAP